jgi:hypothetical protein
MSAPNRFAVGDAVIIAVTTDPRWSSANETIGTVLTTPRDGRWAAVNPGTGLTEVQRGQRYLVRTIRGDLNFEESMLRPLKGDRRKSTWERFERATGMRFDRAPNAVAAAKPAKSVKVRS